MWGDRRHSATVGDFRLYTSKNKTWRSNLPLNLSIACMFSVSIIDMNIIQLHTLKNLKMFYFSYVNLKCVLILKASRLSTFCRQF